MTINREHLAGLLLVQQQVSIANPFAAEQLEYLIAQAQAAPVAEPVAWECRAFHGEDTSTPGWGAWERVTPWNSTMATTDDRVAEIRDYIARGYRYELRALYTHPRTHDAELAELLGRIATHLEYDAIGSPSEAIAGGLAEELRAKLVSLQKGE